MKLISYFNPLNWVFPPSRRYRLEVPALESEIQKIKDFAQAICGAAGYCAADANVVKLVLEEVGVNIVRHAYQGRPPGKIHLEMGIGWLGLKMTVVDQGQAFDFENVKDPDLNHYVDIGKKGGLGIWFIRKMMTKVSYRANADHNVWTLYYRPSGVPKSREFGRRWSDSFPVKFISAFFVLFSFLILLVYVLACLVLVPGAGIDHSFSQRLHEGLGTSLGRGIVLVYAMGLAGFYLIFAKLFKPFRDQANSKFYKPNQWQPRRLPLQDQEEYERLLKMISDMELKVKNTESKLAEQEKVQLEMRVMENALQEDLTVIEQNKNELKRLSDLKNQLDVQLKEAQARMTIQKDIHEGMQKEVKVAQQIQHALLPKEFPQVEGFQIGASYRAAKEVGGDYYDFIWVDPTTLGIAVGDVAGKGVPGSIVMAMIRTAMRLEARNNKSPANVLLKVHQHVTGDMKRGMFATMFYIILDSRNRSISYASAGHNPMILYRKSTDEVYFLKPKGFPLGIDLPDESLFAKTLGLQKLSLQKEDVLMIYTDGVTEAMNPSQEQFGEERLIQAIRENAHRTPEELVQKLEADIADFTAGAEQNDDVTIVAIKENMQAEDVIYKFRKNLLNLVDKEGLSIAEACRQMNVSTQTYYHYKEIYDKKGFVGLKPVLAKKRAAMRELSMAQKNAVMSVVKSNPELGASKIVEFLKKNGGPQLKMETSVVAEFLTRKGLGEAKERKVFAANEIDTV